MVHWPPSHSGGVSMAPGAALGKKTEALRNSSPGGAHARAQPELRGGGWAWIWVNLPFVAQLRSCPWPEGAVSPDTSTCQRWGGMDGRMEHQEDSKPRAVLRGCRCRGTDRGAAAWENTGMAGPAATGGIKINPGYIFF